MALPCEYGSNYRIEWKPAYGGTTVVQVYFRSSNFHSTWPNYRDAGVWWISIGYETIPPHESVEEYWKRLQTVLDHFPDPARTGEAPALPCIECPF